MKTWIGVLNVMALIALCLSGCMGQSGSPVVVEAPSGTRVSLVSPADPYTWFDKPLDGFTIPQNPYEIVFHGSAHDGITAVELYINDALMTHLDDPAPGQTLVTVKYQWTPPRLGRYVLRAQTMNPAKQWSDPALVTVNVIGSTTQTPNQVVTTTVTPTFTPTSTPTRVAQPFAIQKSSDQFYFGGTTCGPTSITLEVQISDLVHIQGVTLFFHLQDKVSGQKTSWNNGLGMQAEGGGKFEAIVPSNAIPSYNRFQDSLFLYQFAGTGAGNAVIQRSQVYGDITLSACGAYVTPVVCSQYTNAADCNANPACQWPMGVGGGACQNK
jgi:hypothetical protein